MAALITRGRSGVAAALLTLAVALPGCSSSGASAEGRPSAPAETGRPPELVSAALEDAFVVQDNGLVSWTTTWRACFGPASGDSGDSGDIVAWETQAVTPEGTSPETDVLRNGCIDLDVAAGVDPSDAGMTGREIQLADAQALAYRVRGVRADDTVTPWTEPVRVGTELTPG
jgi:hypothetical protein